MDGERGTAGEKGAQSRMVFVLGILLGIAALGAWELYLRSLHVFPGYPLTSPHLYWRARHAVKPESLVLVGASAVAANLEQKTLADVLERDVVIFRQEGTTIYEPLEYLAEDESFKGMALVSVNADSLIAVAPKYENRDARWKRLWKQSLEMSPALLVHGLLRDWLDMRLAFRRKDVALSNLIFITNFSRKSWLASLLHYTPSGELIMARREGYSDLAAKLRKYYLSVFAMPVRASDEQKFNALIGRLKKYRESIQSRGGQVVFVYFGVLEADFQSQLPQDRFDVLCARTGARCVTVDSKKYEDTFAPEDGTHLGSDQRGAFSVQFSEELKSLIQSESRTHPASWQEEGPNGI